jgi:hypothetical protein
MAKQKAKRPETKSVTLSTGTKVTGPVASVDKMVARDRGAKRKAKALPAPAPASTPVEDDPAGESEPTPQGDPAGDVDRPTRGASLAAWAGFADTVGFTYPDGATRDQIRDAYEAEHPAE